MEIFITPQNNNSLTEQEIRQALLQSIKGRDIRRALIIPPDFTRFHSGAGLITNIYYHEITSRGGSVDILPALGTHVPVTEAEAHEMFGDIPFERFIAHNWRTDVTKLGEISGEFMDEITDGLWRESVAVEVNTRLLDPNYDIILSVGQVVPHEVIGMANHSKNIFVGVGGADMINKSHMVGALYGIERTMGRDFTPVRRMFDHAAEHFLADLPIIYALTACTAPDGIIDIHGLFIGDTRRCLERAIELSLQKNVVFLPEPIKKCVVFLDPKEFKSTWLGNKAVYRTRMAMADDGELIVLASGVSRFGEDDTVDMLIRKYGYRGRLQTLKQFEDPQNSDLHGNPAACAHLIQGSSDGRFVITYAVRDITLDEIEGVGYNAAEYEKIAARYNPNKLKPGYNNVDGEEIYYINNPALGLWNKQE